MQRLPALLCALLGAAGCCLTVSSPDTSAGTGTSSGTVAGTSGTGSAGSVGATTAGASATGATSSGGSSTGEAVSASSTGTGTSSGGQTTGKCAAATLFASASTFSVGSSPFGIVAADLNGDGSLDLAVADNGQDRVWILLGNGSGAFGPAVGYPEGGASFALTTADFNRDGVADLAVTNSGPGTVTVLIGDGDGGFGGPQAVPAGGGPNCVVAADLDRDGRLDLVTSNYQGGLGDTVSVMLGQSDGGFAAPASYSVGAGAIFVVASDFDGDQIPDLLAVAQHANTLSLLPGVGNGTFAPARAFGASAGNYPAAIGIGNFNGSLGVAVADWGGDTIAILTGPVSSSEQPAIINVGLNPNSVAVADFDGDGILDLAVAEAQISPSSDEGAIELLIGKGDGTFATPVTFGVGADAVTVIAADLNGDGKPDLAVANAGGNVSTLLNACP